MSHQMSYDTLAIELGQVALQRDTYRNLCEELLKELKTLKRSAEKLEAPHEKQSVMFFYYLSGLSESVALSNSVITKAEAILGGNNGTAN